MKNNLLNNLQGVHILITRPAEQSKTLESILSNHGAKVSLFPTIKITANTNLEDHEDPSIKSLSNSDVIIFASANAVRFAAPIIVTKKLHSKSCVFAAIGDATEKKMKEFGLKSCIRPKSNFNSENLLTLPFFKDVGNKKIVIVRGNSGRELLAQILKSRGAHIQYLEAYKREIPKDVCFNIKKYSNPKLDLITITSVEILNNLVQMADKKSLTEIKRILLAVGNKRIGEECKNQGFEQKHIIAKNPSDEDMLEAILDRYK